MRKKRGARLGQHFLKSLWAARALTHAAQIKPSEIVLEIGPGKGALTRELLKASDRVIAIEKDTALVEHLKDSFSEEIKNGTLSIISSDIRDIDPKKIGLTRGEYVLAANIPYYITGEIIRQFLETTEYPRALVLLVQKEVAQRITSKRESILSLSVKAYGTPKLVEKVGRGNFSPPPSVDSAILLINNVSKEFFKEISEKDFFTVLHAGFSAKRKFLSNTLAATFPKEKVVASLQKNGIVEKTRAETVPLDKWKLITQDLFAQ